MCLCMGPLLIGSRRIVVFRDPSFEKSIFQNVSAIMKVRVNHFYIL